MINCEICGKKDQTFIILVEGTKLNVCNGCKSFGNEIYQPLNKPNIKLKINEMQEVVVNNYFDIIKKSRENLKLNQEDFAKRINQKTSFVAKIENGELNIDLELAKKLEKILNIKLITKEKYDEIVTKNKDNKSLTIGDMLNLE